VAKWNHNIVKFLRLSPDDTLSRFRKDLDIRTLARQYADIRPPAIKLLNTNNYVTFVANNLLEGVDPAKVNDAGRKKIRSFIVEVPQLRALIVAPRDLVVQIYRTGQIPAQIAEAMDKVSLFSNAWRLLILPWRSVCAAIYKRNSAERVMSRSDNVLCNNAWRAVAVRMVLKQLRNG
jgi:hypothetical protein